MSKPVKLLQITHGLGIGGLERVVATLCETIDRSRFDVSILCLRERGELASEMEQLGIPVYLLPQKSHGTDYLSFLKIAEVIRKTGAEILHTHNTQPFIEGAMAGKITGIKHMVHTDHGRQWPDKRRYMFAERVAANFAHRVVGVSKHTSECLMRHVGIPSDKVVTIPNGIIGEHYRVHLDRDRKLAELGLSGSEPVIGVGCRLVESKGIAYLIDAVAGLRNRWPKIKLLIAGDGPAKTSLQAYAADAGVGESVAFLGARTDMAELLALFDVYVLPSLSEGLPMALLEAMAAGCPVVATHVGGIPTCIQHGHSGLLVPAADPSALESAIGSLLDSPSLQQRYASEAQRHFQENFSAVAMTRQYELLYQGLEIEGGSELSRTCVS